MIANLTLLRKGMILVAIPLAFQLVFLGLMLATRPEVSKAQARAIHTKEVLAKVERVYRRLVESQGEARELVATGDPARGDEAGRSSREVEQGLAELIGLVEDNEAQRERARAIAAGTTALIAGQREAVADVRAGRLDAARARIAGPSATARLDALRRAMDEFRGEEEQLDRGRMAALGRTSRWQALVMLAGASISVAGAVTLLFVFARGIGRRFAVLTENARRLIDGQELASPLPGRDEIARLDRAFHAMAKSIDEKNRENELFIYSVSHDLRSPLVNLQGFSQELGYASRELRGLLEDGSVPAPIRAKGLGLLGGEVADSIHFIRTAVSRLSVIIDALLRLSRAGRVEYRWQPVDLDATLRRVIESLGSTIAGRGAEVSAGPMPPAWGDPTAIEQVFANLVGNAVNYLDPARPGVVEVGAVGADSPQNGAAHRTYYVRDNGLGIPDSGRSKLFLAFQRFHDGRAQGEGIGLALVRKIVERHGGRIWAESTPGAGSTFYVELPTPPLEGPADHMDRREIAMGREVMP